MPRQEIIDMQTQLIPIFVAVLLASPSLVRSAEARAAAVQVPEAQAAILLKSGNRVAGEFQDIQNDEIYLRLSPTEERRIPVDGVLVVDFEGSARNLPHREAELAAGRGHVLVLTDATVWTGRLQDVHREGEGGGRTIADAPVEFVFEHDGRTDRVAMGRVARLYLGEIDLTRYQGAVEAVAAAAPETPAAVAPASAAASAAGPFAIGQPGAVPATSQWTPTGIVVTAGELVSFRTSGQITLGPGEMATADGSRTERRDPSAPLPQVLAGALIGRVGSGAPFGIGSQIVPLRMPAGGQLFLGVNEGAAGLADNAGQFAVTITK
jgi:hypothetical protein